MSLQDIYKEAGVVMKPAAMKDGKLYSQQPHSGAGDFNFSRADGVQTRINKHGLIEAVADNEPRLSYDIVDGKVSDCPHLLLEPTRTNQIQRSEEFDDSYWTKANVVVTANETTSPDGSVNADKIKENVSSSNVFTAYRTNTSVAAGSYSYSAFIKQGSLRYGGVRAIVNSFVNRFFVNVDLQTGIVTSTNTVGSGVAWDYEVEKYPSGWYRVKIYASHTSGNIDIAIGLSNSAAPSYAAGLPSYSSTGDDYIYSWGAMIEAGSYSTSYIPTSGSTETRQADVCNGSGNSETFNGSEGVLYAEIAFAESQSSSSHRISLSNGTTSHRMIIQQNNNATPNRLQFYFITTLSAQTSFQHTLTDITQFNKIAFKYKENDFAVWVNGIEVLTDTSGVTFPEGTVNQLNFDDGVGGNDFYGKVMELTVINEALTDEQLQLLTTP
jgi:hypothetical protein